MSLNITGSFAFIFFFIFAQFCCKNSITYHMFRNTKAKTKIRCYNIPFYLSKQLDFMSVFLFRYFFPIFVHTLDPETMTLCVTQMAFQKKNTDKLKMNNRKIPRTHSMYVHNSNKNKNNFNVKKKIFFLIFAWKFLFHWKI